MDLSKAQEAFNDLLGSVNEDSKANFLLWIQRVWFVAECSGEGPAIADRKLRDLAEEIRTQLPTSAIYPSERLFPPNSPENRDCKEQHTIHVDAFLYDEMDVDDLVEEGKLSRNYCCDCNSHNTAPLTFVTHSASIRRLSFIFRSLLPYQEGTTIVDVGSRLGAMLYGAYVYTKASRIIGVEMNSDFCQLQNQMIQKHGMTDRMRVVCDDVRNQSELLSNADVLILNNVFEFFLPIEEQKAAWQFLRHHVTKKGSILVTIPSLESIWDNLKLELELNTWVKKRPITDPLVALTAQDQDELAEVCTYLVL